MNYMKKTSFFIILTALFTFTSCSEKFSDNYEANKGETIQFASPFISGSTRSATGDITFVDDLKGHEVKVWGETYGTDSYEEGTPENIFGTNGFSLLSWNETNSQWTYDDIAFWNEAKNYDFVGLAPANDFQSSYVNGKVNVKNIPVVQVVDNGMEKKGIDLLLSDTYTSKASEGKRKNVALNMKHLLSKLSVYVWKSLGEEQKVTLKDMQIYLPGTTAVAEYSQGNHSGPNIDDDTWNWTNFENKPNAQNEEELDGYQAYELTSGDVVVPECSSTLIAELKASKLNKDFFIAPSAPATSTTLYVKVQYEIENGGSVVTVNKFAKLTGLDGFKQGYKHNVYVCLGEQVVSFSINRIESWQSESEVNSNITNLAGHDYGFMAMQDGFDIIGVVKLNDYSNPTFGMAEISLTGSSEVHEAEMALDGWFSTSDCKGTAYSKPSADARFAKFRITPDPAFMTENGQYTLTLKNDRNDRNSCIVDISFAVMQLTVETNDADREFTIPMAIGDTPSQIAFVWGDGSASTIVDKQVSASDLSHTYDRTGTFPIRIISLQTDESMKQIPEFNFGKYPTVTANLADYDHLSFDENENGHMVISIDKPVLNSGTSNISAMFYGTNIKTVCSDLFKNYSNATVLDALFRGCSSLTTVPAHLFDKMKEVTSMSWLFRECSSLTSLPSGLLSRQSNCYSYIQLIIMCENLKINSDLFIDESAGITKSTRFASCTKPIRIDNMFWDLGKSCGSDAGTLPDLWNYNMPNKYGFYKNVTDKDTSYRYPLNKENTFKWTNGDIPTTWYSAVTFPGIILFDTKY